MPFLGYVGAHAIDEPIERLSFASATGMLASAAHDGSICIWETTRHAVEVCTALPGGITHLQARLHVTARTPLSSPYIIMLVML